MSRDRAHMSTIGREGGHSRGRARQSGNIGGSPISTGATDTERSGYIGHANDRGSQASDRGTTTNRNESNANRNESGSFSGRNQF